VVGLAPRASSSPVRRRRPRRAQVIPGLVVPQTGGVEASEDHADGDDIPAVRLFAPGGEAAESRSRLVPESGFAAARRSRTTMQAGQRARRAARRARRRACTPCASRSDAPVVAAASARPSAAPTARRMPRALRPRLDRRRRRRSSTPQWSRCPPGRRPRSAW
jgi:hypothetical protein